MKLRPRPICPECGSADVVVVGVHTGKCNRCGEMFRAAAARDYPGGIGEGIQRSSLDDREGRAAGDDAWIARELQRSIRR